MTNQWKRCRWMGVLALGFAVGASGLAASVSPGPVATPPAAVTQDRSATAGRPNALGMEFVRIAPGEFQMGCSAGSPENECDADEKPHLVRITKAFEIGKVEVTQKQWQAVMGTNPSRFKGENLPVDGVSWDDAQEFINKLNARNDDYRYRLPTEGEWEYAARAGTTDRWAGSLYGMAWQFGTQDGSLNVSQLVAGGYGDAENSGGISHEVATKQPNAWGLYDMRGNVMEWVQDWYDATYYARSPASDPVGPPSGEYRIMRGGSYRTYPWLTRVSIRFAFPPAYSFFDTGFRCVRETP